MRTALLSLALLAAPVAATALDTDSFIDAKTGYRVEISHQGEAMLLDGYNFKTRDRFHIKVVRDHVTGVFAGTPVNYVMSPDRDAHALLASSAR